MSKERADLPSIWWRITISCTFAVCGLDLGPDDCTSLSVYGVFPSTVLHAFAFSATMWLSGYRRQDACYLKTVIDPCKSETMFFSLEISTMSRPNESQKFLAEQTQTEESNEAEDVWTQYNFQNIIKQLHLKNTLEQKVHDPEQTTKIE